MFKHFFILLIAAFLFSACAERGITPGLPITTVKHTTPLSTKKNLPATKSVIPAQAAVKTVTKADKKSKSFINITQNSIAGLLVFAIALTLII